LRPVAGALRRMVRGGRRPARGPREASAPRSRRGRSSTYQEDPARILGRRPRGARFRPREPVRLRPATSAPEAPAAV